VLGDERVVALGGLLALVECLGPRRERRESNGHNDYNPVHHHIYYYCTCKGKQQNQARCYPKQGNNGQFVQ
jgi:hypothetical protein